MNEIKKILPKRNHIKSVLVLVPDKHLGDFLMSLSSVLALKDFFSEQRFYVVMDSAYAEIIETTDAVSNVIFYPRALLASNRFVKRMKTLTHFLIQLRSSSPDLAIDLHGGVASSTMTLLSGAPLRVGRSTAKKAYFYSIKVPPPAGKHKFYNCTEIASAVGIKNEIKPYRISASKSKRTALDKILLDEGIAINKPIISLHPGAGAIYKRWTTEGFSEIADWLASRKYQVIFIGGKRESDDISKVRALMKHASYDFCGKLSLGELIALFEKSLLYIGNDSGPLHLAAATGIPVVALFGAANERRWGPFSEKSIVLRGCDRCEKCKGKDCEYDFKCIRTISPSAVKNAVEKLLMTHAKSE